MHYVRPCSSPLGLPGVGKTTRARELASTHRVLRLTPDEWMAPLFRESEADGRRDVLEGRMIWVAHPVHLIRRPGSPGPRPRRRALGAALDRLGNAWSRRTLALVGATHTGFGFHSHAHVRLVARRTTSLHASQTTTTRRCQALRREAAYPGEWRCTQRDDEWQSRCAAEICPTCTDKGGPL
jgi:hypothetical protein